MLALVISEFMADNESTLADDDGDYSDWIEIRNASSQSVDLTGWHLTDKAGNPDKWQFPQVSLSAGEHLVVFASEKDRTNPQAPLHTNFKLSADGEYLGLVEPDGVTVAFDYGDAYPGQTEDVSYGLSADLGVEGFFPQPSPGRLNPGLPISDPSRAVVISEIMYSLPRADLLDAENVDEEFIELHNRGFERVDVGGWRFARGVDITLPDASIEPGGFLVVAANLNSFAAKYPTVENVVAGWTGTLSNSGETLELVDGFGNRVDELRYADEGDWSLRTEGPADRGHTGWIWTAGHDGGGKSLELINRNQSNDFGQNWASSLPDAGTPGATNSVDADNVAPLIQEVMHSPILPTSSESVTITALLHDESVADVAATLNWRLDGEPAFRSLAMRDDGLHGDGEANDGLFGATLAAQADRTVVEFYVQAWDATNLTRTWPAPTAAGEQKTNALYQVLDGIPRLEPGDPPIYHQIMTGAERQEFTAIDRLSNAQFNATFIAVTGTGIDLRYNTGVRIRGSASRNDEIPNNRIRIPSDRPWNGLTRINVNARAPVNQVSGSALFRLAGLPASDVHAVRMFSNGVDIKNGGFYVHAEVLDGDFAQNHYPLDDAGNIYRGRRPNESPPGGLGAGLQYRGQEQEPYVSYVKNTNASAADWSDIINLTFQLNESPAETYVQDVQQVANVDQWFRAFAMNSLIDNNENGLFTGDSAGDDYAMYRGIDDPRFEMIPYDWDSLYGNVNRDIFRPNSVPALRQMINHPEFLPRYYAQFIDLIDHVIMSETLKPTLIEALGDITSEARIDEIHQFLVNRGNAVRALINEQLTVETGLPIQHGLPQTASPNLSLSGTAPVTTTRSVLVNGKPAEELDGNGNWSLNSQAVASTVLLDAGSVWRYLDDGSDQGQSWRERDFDDAGWSQGAAQLGYGDGDETTTIGFGGDPDNRFLTSYFRSTFQVDNPADFDSLSLELLFDDGAAVYINGIEAARLNLAADAAYDTRAESARASAVEQQFERVAVTAAAFDSLVAGTNTIAVEVHQVNPGSSDVSMDARLSAVMRGVPSNESQLFPGVNRLTVDAFDGPLGSGRKVASDVVDVWYDDGDVQDVIGAISSHTTWRAEDGPYRVFGNVTVNDGIILAIEPGTTVFFTDDAKLTVRGQLLAIGKPYETVRFTREPGSSSWDGIQFEGSMSDNRIEYAIIEYGVTDDGLIGLEDSQLTIDKSTLDHTTRRRIRSIDSSLIVRNSTFTNIADPGVAPATDNRSEHIWGRGVPDGGQWILEGNRFGHLTGHNDAIDFDAPRLPNPIPIIRDNVFDGGGDDALDMTGDVYVEGNVFRNFIKDEFNRDPGESNTISASGGDFWVIRNVFDNVQHASLVKEDAFMHFLNNSVVSSSASPLYFDLPGQTSGPGRGADVQGSIFVTQAPTFAYVDESIELSVNHTFMPTAEFDLGTGNRFGDPHIGDAQRDYQLLPGSPASRSGPNGVDMGARIGAGASLSGVPLSPTAETSANVVVGGPDITHYRFRLNDGPWSPERPISAAIQMAGLSPGSYTLAVVGRNSAGQWQDDAEATVSETWIVDPAAAARVRLNEVLADNISTYELDGEFPDAIELYNHGTVDFDLGGYSLSDRGELRDKFVFPAGTRLAPGQFLVLTGEKGSNNGDLTLSFDLDSSGEGVYLFDRSGRLIDSVEFGQQLADRSIGVLDESGEWNLNLPTIGAPNSAAPLDDASEMRINEWLATADVRMPNDFIELYNPQTHAVAMGGLWLTDEAVAIPARFQIPALSFIAGQGYSRFIADDHVEDGKDHTNFRLSSIHEHLALLTEDLQFIDQVFYYSQTREVSQGRVPDGSAEYAFFRVPTPQLTNNRAAGTTIPVLDFSWDTSWRYEASANDLGTQWRSRSFDDAGWETGSGLLGNENEPLPQPLVTSFPLGGITYYFRKHVPIDQDPMDIEAQFSTIIDDGAVVYVNGQEVLRLRMPGGDIQFDQVANGNVNEAQLEGPFSIPANAWVRGDNVIAVEVHQVRTNSSDLVFGMELTANKTLVDPSAGNREALLDGLRITEVMYNPASDDELEFIELQNVGDATLDLNGVRLDGGVRFVFPPILLAAGDRVVVAENSEAMLATFGNGINLVGQFAGNLANGGDELVLQLADPFDAAILRFDYDPAWDAATDGGGRSLEIVNAGTPFDQWGNASNWQSSATLGGTPGFATNQLPPSDGIVINEILSHTDLPLIDSIELYNRSGSVINLSGWYLSDSDANVRKYRIPAGTLLGAGDYLLFDETNFNRSAGLDPHDFALDSAHGDTVWLWKADSDGNLQRIVDTVEFGATANAESWGRVPNGVGELTPLEDPSFGRANGAPRVGPVVISEVNYHPQDPSAAALRVEPGLQDDDLEYVEILNPTNDLLDLTDWRIRRGIDFDFAAGTSLSPRSALLVVAFDPRDPSNASRLEAFRVHYGLSETTPIVGGYLGKLDNGGEAVQLQRPDEPPLGEPDFIPRLFEDEIRYDDVAPWPVTADGRGKSLERQLPANFGRDASSWRANDPTPGVVAGIATPGDFNGDGVVEHADIQLLCAGIRSNERRFDLNGDQVVDAADLSVLINDILGTTVGDSNLDGQFNSSDLVQIFQAGEYEDGVDGNSTWAEGDWNCDGDFNTRDLVLAFQSGSYSAAAKAHQAFASPDVAAAVLGLRSDASHTEPVDAWEPPESQEVSPTHYRRVSATFQLPDLLFDAEHEIGDRMAQDIAAAESGKDDLLSPFAPRT